MSMDGLPGKFSRFDTQNNFPLKCCSAKSFLKTPIPYGLAMKVTFLGPAISRFLAAPEIACVLLHKKKGSGATWSKNSYSRAAFWGFSPSNASSTWFRDTLPDWHNKFFLEKFTQMLTTHVSFQSILRSVPFRHDWKCHLKVTVSDSLRCRLVSARHHVGSTSDVFLWIWCMFPFLLQLWETERSGRMKFLTVMWVVCMLERLTVLKLSRLQVHLLRLPHWTLPLTICKYPRAVFTSTWQLLLKSNKGF